MAQLDVIDGDELYIHGRKQVKKSWLNIWQLYTENKIEMMLVP